MRTIRTKVYKFSELSEQAKQKAIEKFWDINVMDEWWECTYEDAANIGLNIISFDIDKGYCKGKFTIPAIDVANKIINEHGDKCETFKTGELFIGEYDHNKDNYDMIDDISADFLHSLCEDYLTILRREYEYQTSKEAIIESIEANDYEFTQDGNQFYYIVITNKNAK